MRVRCVNGRNKSEGEVRNAPDGVKNSRFEQMKSAMTPILQKLIQQQDWVYALTLGILAAFPRLYRLDLAEFKLDEANHYRMAYFLTRGAWRWVGSTSSIGFPKPPLFIYATALPMALSRDPIAPHDSL